MGFINQYLARLKICKDRVLSATSSDGFKWRHDRGIRIDVCRPPLFSEEMVYGCWVGKANGGFEMLYQGSKVLNAEWSSDIYHRFSSDSFRWGPCTPLHIERHRITQGATRVQSPFLHKTERGDVLYFAATGKDGVTRIVQSLYVSGKKTVVPKTECVDPKRYDLARIGKVTGLADPSIVKLAEGGGYRMYLSATLDGSPFRHCIVSAYSADGVSWAAEPGARVPNGQRGMMETANNPCVLQIGRRYRMWFRGSDAMPLRSHLFHAESTDGINWSVTGRILRVRSWHPYERHGVGFPFVLQLQKSAFRMFYTGYWGNVLCYSIVRYYKKLSRSRTS